MKPFVPVYVPVGVPTFHMESAQSAFERSSTALKAIDAAFVCPEEKLLSLDALRGYLNALSPDLVVFQ
ncbi:MAG: fucose isomerase, partial [Clostridia bacterium]|nr:fucose isomerase [Clostridia bacterium]